MSGSGSSGDLGGGGYTVDCSKLSFETHINSPNPNELTKLKQGDVLSIVLDTEEPIEILKVVNSGNVVGGILDRGAQLKMCIKSGFKFEAVVRSISGAAIKIFVQAET